MTGGLTVSLMGNYVYIQQENVEDILLQNVNNWSHTVSASSLIFPGRIIRSCNELKSDENCLLLLCFVHSCSVGAVSQHDWQLEQNKNHQPSTPSWAGWGSGSIIGARLELHVVPVISPAWSKLQWFSVIQQHLAPVGATESNIKDFNSWDNCKVNMLKGKIRSVLTELRLKTLPSVGQ